MKVTANGVALNCEIEGREGAPWLTFSNSLATNLHMWDDQAAALAEDFRILRYDKRGHGRSDVPAGAYDFPMLVGDVIGLWDVLGIEKSHFVGLSIGGMTAMGLALDHADRLDSIVISQRHRRGAGALRRGLGRGGSPSSRRRGWRRSPRPPSNAGRPTNS